MNATEINQFNSSFLLWSSSSSPFSSSSSTDDGEFNTTIIVEEEESSHDNMTIPIMESVEKISDKEIRNEFTKEVFPQESLPSPSVDTLEQEQQQQRKVEDISGYVIEDSTIQYNAGYDEKVIISNITPTQFLKKGEDEISFLENSFETVTRPFEITTMESENFERRKEEQLLEEEISNSVLNETFYEKDDNEGDENVLEVDDDTDKVEEIMIAMESNNLNSTEIEVNSTVTSIPEVERAEIQEKVR